MSIDDLTVREVKALRELFGAITPGQKAGQINDEHPWVGKYVICRTHNEGVNFGKLVCARDRYVQLSEAQRLYSFAPKEMSASWYEGVAEYGISAESKISIESEKSLAEDYSLTLCSEVCVKSIKGHRPNEQE